MPAKRVEYELEAADEVRDAETRYRERNPGAADRFIDEIESASVLLRDNPEIGPVWEPERFNRRVRRIVLRRYPFVLFYAVGDDAVHVIAVAHTSRKPGYWKDRLGDG